MAVRFSKFKLRKKQKFDLENVGDLEYNLTKLGRELRKHIVVDGLFKGSKLTLSRVKQLIPKGDSRALYRSIDHKKLKSSVRIRVGSKEAFYAPWVEYGTDPHRITKRRKALTIESGFYAAADHKGAKPTPFLRRSMDETRRGVVNIATKSIRDDIEQIRFRYT